MYLLWKYRVLSYEKFVKNEVLNIKIKESEISYTLEEKEKMEYIGLSYVDKGQIPSRFLVGDKILVSILNDIEIYKDIKWMVIKSDNNDFIMPSNPYMKRKTVNGIIEDKLYFPLSSNICLIPLSRKNVIVNKKLIKSLNELMIENSKWFYFWKP